MPFSLTSIPFANILLFAQKQHIYLNIVIELFFIIIPVYKWKNMQISSPEQLQNFIDNFSLI